LNFRSYRVPFLYSTNGEVIWHHDVRHELNRSRQIAQFHTPDALAEFLKRDLEAACDMVFTTPNNHPLIRPYQKDANAATEDAIARRKRHMLLAMATGTGKLPENTTYSCRLPASFTKERLPPFAVTFILIADAGLLISQTSALAAFCIVKEATWPGATLFQSRNNNWPVLSSTKFRRQKISNQSIHPSAPGTPGVKL